MGDVQSWRAAGAHCTGDDLEELLQRINIIEAQMQALTKRGASTNHCSVDTLAAGFDFEARIDHGLDEQAKLTLSSLHTFVESHMNDRVDHIINSISQQIKNIDRCIRRDFSSRLQSPVE